MLSRGLYVFEARSFRAERITGGYALFAHGYQRATTDIDFIFPATLESGILVKKALMDLPEGVAAEIDPAWFVEGDTIRVADEFIIDIMFNACGETYETLNKYKEMTDIDGIPVKTISLDGLLKTKQTPRSKDISDRLILERAINNMDRASLEESKNIANIKSSFEVVDTCSKKYEGKIIGVTMYHVVQSIGMTAVIHCKINLDSIPELHTLVTIKYVDGVGLVGGRDVLPPGGSGSAGGGVGR